VAAVCRPLVTVLSLTQQAMVPSLAALAVPACPSSQAAPALSAGTASFRFAGKKISLGVHLGPRGVASCPVRWRGLSLALSCLPTLYSIPC